MCSQAVWYNQSVSQKFSVNGRTDYNSVQKKTGEFPSFLAAFNLTCCFMIMSGIECCEYKFHVCLVNDFSMNEAGGRWIG